MVLSTCDYQYEPLVIVYYIPTLCAMKRTCNTVIVCVREQKRRLSNCARGHRLPPMPLPTALELGTNLHVSYKDVSDGISSGLTCVHWRRDTTAGRRL